MGVQGSEAVGAEDIVHLRQVRLFHGLTDEQLGELLAAARRIEFPAGETIIQENATGDSMYLLVSGSVEISKTLTLLPASHGRSKEKTLMRLDARETGGAAVFGEMGILTNTERSASVTALTPCVAYELTKEEFTRLVESDYQLGYCLVRNLAVEISSRLSKTNRDVLKLATALTLALGNR